MDDLTRPAMAARDGDRVALAAFVRRAQRAVCRCPVGTIRSRVSRARADLVAAMADEAEQADK